MQKHHQLFLQESGSGWKKLDRIARVLWVLFIGYFFSIQLIADGLWLKFGGLIENGVFFVIFHFGLLCIGLFLNWKSHHLLILLGRIGFLGLIGYFLTRQISYEFLSFAPTVSVLAIVGFGILFLNLVVVIHVISTYIRINRTWEHIRMNRSSFTLKIALIFSAIWFPLLGWGYMGFSQTILITDPTMTEHFSLSNPWSPGQSQMRIGFYGYPFGSINAAYYNTSMWDQEAAYYLSMQSIFCPPWYKDFHNSSTTLSTYANVFHELEKKGIPFMLDLGPSDNKTGYKDFFSYYYVENMNLSFDIVSSWIVQENFTNFLGFDIDPEGPKYSRDDTGREQIVNTSQHAFAAISIQNKVNELRQLHPTWIFRTISVTVAMFDWFDGDRDNDIMLKSISAEPLDFDYFGWQTYMVQGTTRGNSEYYEFLKIGYGHYGQKMIPWIGWANDYTEITDPTTYQNTLTQIKICKSFRFPEVVIAPSRHFLAQPNPPSYSNFADAIARLAEYNRTLNEPFTPMEIPIHQNARIYTNFPLWVQKLNPNYFQIQGNVVEDLIVEINGGWLLFYQIGQAIGISCVMWWKLKGEKTKK